MQSIPLLANPDGIIKDLSPKDAKPAHTSTVLERYFARFAGFTSLSLSVSLLLLTNSLPYAPSTRTVTGQDVMKLPALYVSMGYLTALAGFTGFMSATTGVQGFLFHTITCSVLTALGAYCLVSA